MRSRMLFLALVMVPPLMADDATKSRKVPFELHSGYFVSNKHKMEGDFDALALKSKMAFNRVFGVAFVMGDTSNRLKPNAFKTKMVLAVIKKGRAAWTYKVSKVIAKGKTLYVDYKPTPREATGNTTFASPMIVSIPKGDYNKAVFVENGKEVKSIAIK